MRPLLSSALSRRPLGAAALALFLAAQAGGLWHEATERHAICAEHGDVIEASGERAHAPAERVDEADPQLSTAGSPQIDHGHCQVFLRRTDSKRLDGAAVEAPVGVTALEAATVVALAPARSRDVLRLAPKASPPV